MESFGYHEISLRRKEYESSDRCERGNVGEDYKKIKGVPTFKIEELETWDGAIREIGSPINPTRINKPSDDMHRNV